MSTVCTVKFSWMIFKKKKKKSKIVGKGYMYITHNYQSFQPISLFKVKSNCHLTCVYVTWDRCVGLAFAREVLMFSILSMLLMQLLGTLAQARRM